VEREILPVMNRAPTPDTIALHLAALPSPARERLTTVLSAPSFAGKLDANIVDGVGMKISDLMSALLPLAQLYALAGFRVGAITQGATGALYLGANLEIPRAPLGWTIHAEQSAVMGALAHREKLIRRLAVTSAPCGHCRQFLNELADANELEILLANHEPFTLAELLPEAFGPANLGMSAALLARDDLPVPAVAGGADILARAALDALSRSHAPYTFSPSAVALETRDGVVAAGPYVENAAYNPSMPPMLAALDRLRFRSALAATVGKAMLVEVEGSRIDQAASSREILAAAGSDAELTVLKVQLADE
jgi:cytidine deaminase